MDWTDAEYVERCLNGCPDDYRLIVERYQGKLMSFLTVMLGDRSQAEEAAQESFVRAYFSLHKLKNPQSLHAWLLGIASRVAKREIRSTKRRRQLHRDLAHAPAASNPAVECMDYPLQQAVADLPGAYRRVILLRYYGGLSCQALAEELNMPLGTVTKMLSRAYGMLREALRGKQAVTGDRAEVQS